MTRSILAIYTLLLISSTQAWADYYGRMGRPEDVYHTYDNIGDDIGLVGSLIFCIFFYGIFYFSAYLSKKRQNAHSQYHKHTTHSPDNLYNIDLPEFGKRNIEILRKNIDSAIENKLNMTFSYTNNRGIFSSRRVLPLENYKINGKDYVRCFDLDKKEERVFSLRKIQNLIIED